jgi:hypothetical protein
LQAVLPVLARNPGEVHLAAADLDRFAIEQKIVAADREARFAGGLHMGLR